MKLKVENVNETKGKRRNRNKIAIRSRKWKKEFAKVGNDCCDKRLIKSQSRSIGLGDSKSAAPTLLEFLSRLKVNAREAVI